MFIHSISLPKVIDSRWVHEGFFNLRIDSLELPPHLHMQYTVLEVKNHATAILAYTREKKLVVLKEYRHPVGKWLLGCPGGRIDSGESPIETAKRELLEETGYTAEDFVSLGSACPFPSAADQLIFYVLATGAHKIQEPLLEPFELIRHEEITEKELYQAIQSGYPVDGILCTALFFHSIHHKKGENLRASL